MSNDRKGFKDRLKDAVYRHCGGILYENGIREIESQNWELIYSNVWRDTVRDIDWINSVKGISPGRWAVGYNYIYVLTRVLNELKPRKILDLGLGISSSIISAYVDHASSCAETDKDEFRHLVIEQNEDWYKAYIENHAISKSTTVEIHECIEKDYCDERIYAYKDFKEAIDGKVFDVISIDGPWGGEEISRMDVVEYLPDIIGERFVIIIDDTNRKGEKRLIEEISRKLRDNGIDFDTGNYRGISDCTVISYKGGWFTTL